MTNKNPFTADQYNRARPDRYGRRGHHALRFDWFVCSMIVMPIVAALVMR